MPLELEHSHLARLLQRHSKRWEVGRGSFVPEEYYRRNIIEYSSPTFDRNFYDDGSDSYEEEEDSYEVEEDSYKEYSYEEEEVDFMELFEDVMEHWLALDRFLDSYD